MRDESERTVQFDVWGCRGSRNLIPSRSAVGNLTSCYSLLAGRRVTAFDAGSGLAALGHAMRAEARFGGVTDVDVLVSHAHMDHWEGLKDVDWFWYRENGLNVTVHGTDETLEAIRGGFDRPSYVPLERLAMGTVQSMAFARRVTGESFAVGEATVTTFPLNHYSGSGDSRWKLDTIGYRLSVEGGPSVAYLSDHEPTDETAAAEAEAVLGTDLVVYDSQYLFRKDHAYGHGSQEHAASVARQNPGTLVLAGHLGTLFSDERLREVESLHRGDLTNYALAVEGRTYVFSQGGFLLQAEGRRQASPAREAPSGRSEVVQSSSAREAPSGRSDVVQASPAREAPSGRSDVVQASLAGDRGDAA